MFAVLKTGGKQYKVAANDVLTVEKLTAEAGATVQFDEILMLGGDDGHGRHALRRGGEREGRGAGADAGAEGRSPSSSAGASIRRSASAATAST